MERTRLSARQLPDYTRGEEIFHMVSHVVGASLGVAALVLCVVAGAVRHSPWAVVSGAVYGASLILLYTISSVYHGLRPNMGKKVMQVIDHCAIYFLIAGSYTPVVLCSIREVSPAWGWGLFGAVWGLAAVATAFTAIDLKKYARLSMACYLGMGWCIVLAIRPALEAVPLPGLLWLLAGGVAYTVGAGLYAIGGKRRYFHAIFHLFVVAGSVLQFFGIYFYVIR